MKQLADVSAVIELAATVDNPVVAFDTSGGSSQARFILCSAADHSEHGQMTRDVFNQLRDSGHLEEDPEKRYRMHSRCQAWPVIVPME